MTGLPRKRRRIIRPYEVVLLVIVGFILLHFGLKSLGVNVVNRSEELSWLDKPNGPYEFVPIKEDEDRNRNVDNVLDNIAVQFAEDKSKNRNTSKRDLKKKGLTDDEAEYYRDVQQREDGEGMSATDWVDAVQTSYKTYKTVKSIFDKVDGRKDGDVDTEGMNQILSDPELKDITFSDLEKTFNIARPTIEAFAKRGSRAVNDWATFVDQNKRE